MFPFYTGAGISIKYSCNTRSRFSIARSLTRAVATGQHLKETPSANPGRPRGEEIANPQFQKFSFYITSTSGQRKHVPYPRLEETIHSTRDQSMPFFRTLCQQHRQYHRQHRVTAYSSAVALSLTRSRRFSWSSVPVFSFRKAVTLPLFCFPCASPNTLASFHFPFPSSPLDVSYQSLSVTACPRRHQRRRVTIATVAWGSTTDFVDIHRGDSLSGSTYIQRAVTPAQYRKVKRIPTTGIHRQQSRTVTTISWTCQQTRSHHHQGSRCTWLLKGRHFSSFDQTSSSPTSAGWLGTAYARSFSFYKGSLKSGKTAFSTMPQSLDDTAADRLPLRGVPGSVAKLITEALNKPSLDDRTYRIIELSNGLEALLVHDAETDKASASLDVGVGNFNDDDDMPGTAHAVEHVRRSSRRPLAFSVVYRIP